jgi:uncharacterized membrane protein
MNKIRKTRIMNFLINSIISGGISYFIFEKANKVGGVYKIVPYFFLLCVFLNFIMFDRQLKKHKEEGK